MNKTLDFDPCGLEVSALTLLAQRRRPEPPDTARRALYLPARVAVMRKLLHAIFGMFKHYAPYDGAKVYRPRDVPAPAEISLRPA